MRIICKLSRLIRCLGPFVLGGLTVSATVAASSPVVTGPSGLTLDSLDPPEPFFEHYLTNNRLNLRLYSTNGTGRSLTFQQGSATFRDAQGGVLRTVPLSTEEFIRRSALVSVDGFAGGVELSNVPNHTGERIVAAVLDRQSRIVAAGSARNELGETVAILARYSTNGVLDPAFASDGFRNTGPGVPASVAINAQSQVFVAGTLPGFDGFFVRAVDVDGEELWPEFTHEFSAFSFATAVVVDSVGRVIVGGATLTTSGYRCFFVRFLATGSPDPGFGTAGIRILDSRGATYEVPYALAIDSADRIVAAGWANVSGVTQFYLTRHLASNGGFDPDFDADGRVMTTFAGYDDAQVMALKISPSGRILAGGIARAGTIQRMALARYDTDGGLDPNFSTDGKVVINMESDQEYITDIDLDSIGRIVLTGRAWNDAGEKLAVVRLNGIGQFDPAFSSDGLLLANGPEDWVSASARSIMVLPGDDLVVAGHAESDTDSASTRFALARFRPSGSSAVVPVNALHRLELLDFPVYAALENQGLSNFTEQQGAFECKHTPVRMDLALKFLEFAEPYSVAGIPLTVYEQNASSFRLPLGPVSGRSWTVNSSRLFDTVHGRSRGQRFAYDLSIRNGTSLAVDPNCDPDAMGLPKLYAGLGYEPDIYDPNTTYEPSDFSECYYAYGTPVLAVATGIVRCVTSGSLDNFPVGGPHQPGNGVVIEHAPGEYLAYQHLARDSIVVTPGMTVVAGQKIGKLGNSGSSGGPHLHMHYSRLAPGQEQIFCTNAEGDNNSGGRPTYFNNVFFPSTEGGRAVRQLRTAIPPYLPFTVETNPIPYNTIVLLHGPGLVDEGGAHDTLEAPMHLRLPATVRAAASRATGSSVADAGDTIEDVYRFTLSSAASFSAQLRWNNSADLDMILYDQTLQPILPAAAKTLSRPEILSAQLSPGTYYLFVSLYDPSPGASSASYQLDIGAYPNGRDVYVDRLSACLYPFGQLLCSGGWGGPFPTVVQGNEVVCPDSRMFIRSGTYSETLVFDQPVVVRSYDGTAVIGPP